MFVQGADRALLTIHRIAQDMQVKPRQIQNSGAAGTTVPGATKTKLVSKGSSPTGGEYGKEYSGGKV